MPDRERRHHARVPVRDTELRSHTVRARVVDASPDGLSIESSEALRVGDRYRFTLTLGGHSETFEARILWCRLRRTRRAPDGEVHPVYRAGVERLPSSLTGTDQARREKADS